eukprot:jgi/Mesen1/9902/ME000070S09185
MDPIRRSRESVVKSGGRSERLLHQYELLLDTVELARGWRADPLHLSPNSPSALAHVERLSNSRSSSLQGRGWAHSAKGAAGSPSQENGSSAPSSSSSSSASAAAVAEVEYEWLARKTEELEGQWLCVQGGDRVTSILVAGLACWLCFWDRWQESPPGPPPESSLILTSMPETRGDSGLPPPALLKAALETVLTGLTEPAPEQAPAHDVPVPVPVRAALWGAPTAPWEADRCCSDEGWRDGADSTSVSASAFVFACACGAADATDGDAAVAGSPGSWGQRGSVGASGEGQGLAGMVEGGCSLQERAVQLQSHNTGGGTLPRAVDGGAAAAAMEEDGPAGGKEWAPLEHGAGYGAENSGSSSAVSSCNNSRSNSSMSWSRSNSVRSSTSSTSSSGKALVLVGGRSPSSCQVVKRRRRRSSSSSKEMERETEEEEGLQRRLLGNLLQGSSCRGAGVHTLADVLRHLGLAVAASRAQPASSAIALLRILDHTGAACWLAGRSPEFVACASACRAFVVTCLLELLSCVGSSSPKRLAGTYAADTRAANACAADARADNTCAAADTCAVGTCATGTCAVDTCDSGSEEPLSLSPGPNPDGCPGGAKKGAGAGEGEVFRPLQLAELAEVAAAEALWVAAGHRLQAYCEHIDSLYHLEVGPGLLAVALANVVLGMPDMWPREVLTLAAKFESLGCSVAGFRTRLQAVANAYNGGSSSSGSGSRSDGAPGGICWGAVFDNEPGGACTSVAALDRLLQLALTVQGGEPVPRILARLATSIDVALSRAPSSAERHLLANRFARTLLRPLQGCHAGSAAGNSSGDESWRPSGDHHQGGRGPWMYELAQIFLKISGQLGPLPQLEQSCQVDHIEMCARVIVDRWTQGVEGAGKPAELARTIEGMADPGAEAGWLAWKAIGCHLERSEPGHLALRAMRRKAVLATFASISEEGTCVDPGALEAFDWGLEGMLMELPKKEPQLEPEPQGEQGGQQEQQEQEGDEDVEENSVPLLMSALGPLPPGGKLQLLLAVAARMACAIFWRWPKRKQAPRFVAQALVYAHSSGMMTSGQRRWALDIGVRMWGWTMPDQQKFAARCETAEEAKEVYEEALIACWYSIASHPPLGPLVDATLRDARTPSFSSSPSPSSSSPLAHRHGKPLVNRRLF